MDRHYSTQTPCQECDDLWGSRRCDVGKLLDGAATSRDVIEATSHSILYGGKNDTLTGGGVHDVLIVRMCKSAQSPEFPGLAKKRQRKNAPMCVFGCEKKAA